MNFRFPFFKKQDQRKPAEQVHLIALSNAVLIGTTDGNNIVITPKMAREITPLLPQLADQAERELPEAV